MVKDHVHCCIPEFWVYLVSIVVVVLFAGVASGLALGLLSFSQVDLEVLVNAGQPQDQKNAAMILPIVKNEHLLLCTLLIGKSLAMEALPILLDFILPSWGAILVSVTLVIAFAEIIPQAVCSRHGLSLGAKLSPLVRLLLMVFFPVSYPFSKFLDLLLGKEHSVLLRRAELKTLVDLHANEAGKGGELSHHETTIITGALDLTLKTAKDAMTSISETFSLDINSKLDMHTVGLIMSKGHSRIPIFSGNPKNIIGLTLVKNLIFCRPEDEIPIKYMTVRRIPRVYENWPLYDILNQFQKGHSHMAVVVKSKKDVKHTVNNEAGKPNTRDVITNSNGSSAQEERKGYTGIKSPHTKTEHLSNSTNSTPLYSTDTEYRSPIVKNVMDQDKYHHPEHIKWKNNVGDISYEDLESLPNNLDEEIIGIITMEDVLEELLQGEILDETDEYVDVHNKIRISLPPSSPRSPGRVSRSHLQWRTPEPSPLSSYTPILRSPIAPYIQPPLIRPTLSASPGKSLLSSQPSHRVSRRSYEKLQQFDN